MPLLKLLAMLLVTQIAWGDQPSPFISINHHRLPGLVLLARVTPAKDLAQFCQKRNHGSLGFSPAAQLCGADVCRQQPPELLARRGSSAATSSLPTFPRRSPFYLSLYGKKGYGASSLDSTCFGLRPANL